MTNENLEMFWKSLDEVQKEMFIKLVADLDDPESGYDLSNDLSELVDSEKNFAKSTEEKLVEKDIKESTKELKKANSELKKEINKAKKDIVNADTEELQKLKSVQEYQQEKKQNAEALRERINKLQNDAKEKEEVENKLNQVRKEIKDQKELDKTNKEADKIIDLKSAKLSAEAGVTKKSRLSEFSERLSKLQ